MKQPSKGKTKRSRLSDDQYDLVKLLAEALPRVRKKAWVTIDSPGAGDDLTLWTEKPEPAFGDHPEFWADPGDNAHSTHTSLCGGGFDAWELRDLIRKIHKADVDVMAFRFVNGLEMSYGGDWRIEEVE